MTLHLARITSDHTHFNHTAQAHIKVMPVVLNHVVAAQSLLGGMQRHHQHVLPNTQNSTQRAAHLGSPARLCLSGGGSFAWDKEYSRKSAVQLMRGHKRIDWQVCQQVTAQDDEGGACEAVRHGTQCIRCSKLLRDTYNLQGGPGAEVGHAFDVSSGQGRAQIDKL